MFLWLITVLTFPFILDSVKEQLNAVQELERDVASQKPQMDELELVHQVSYSTIPPQTYGALASGWNEKRQFCVSWRSTRMPEHLNYCVPGCT